RPALADELDGLVEVRANAVPAVRAGRVQKGRCVVGGLECSRMRRLGHAPLRGFAERLYLSSVPLERDLPGEGDESREVRQRDVRERLQDLLVGPALLARLLVQVNRHAALV